MQKLRYDFFFQKTKSENVSFQNSEKYFENPNPKTCFEKEFQKYF